MFENQYLRSHLPGSHREFINKMTEKELLDALDSINAQLSPVNDDKYPTSKKYLNELDSLLKRYYFLRDNHDEQHKDDFLDKLRELARDIVCFEFKFLAEDDNS
jgi:hypothetical protein